MTKIERIEFPVDGLKIVGHLHLPSSAGRHPAVVVGGPMTSVKEQVTGAYAAAMADRGIAALALDHRHYGESDGQPRQYEHSGSKIADLTAGVGFLGNHPQIDAGRLGALGVCLGAGYAAWTTVAAPSLRVFGAVAGYYRDPADMRARDAAGFDKRVQQGVEARRRFEKTGVVETVPAAASDGDAAMQTTDTIDYYTRRAAIPNYTNAFAVMSREHFLPFDVQAAAPRLDVPVLMIHSEKALSPHWARKFHEAVRAPKQMVWMDSQGQTDFYDDPNLIGPAADRLAAHFAETLSP